MGGGRRQGMGGSGKMSKGNSLDSHLSCLARKKPKKNKGQSSDEKELATLYPAQTSLDFSEQGGAGAVGL